VAASVPSAFLMFSNSKRCGVKRAVMGIDGRAGLSLSTVNIVHIMVNSNATTSTESGLSIADSYAGYRLDGWCAASHMCFSSYGCLYVRPLA